MAPLASIFQRQPLFLLSLSAVAALLITLFFSQPVYPAGPVAQISPLSPLTVATPLPGNQSQNSSSSPVQSQPNPGGDRNPSFNGAQPTTPLGAPAQASPSLLLMGGLLAGLVVLVLVVLVARRRE